MPSLSPEKLQSILEAAIMVADHPLTVAALQNLFPENDRPSNAEIKAALSLINSRYQMEESGIQLQEVASGYRIQAKADLSPWLGKLWEERAPRYSRAFLETLALIAYKQPITRGEIEEIRGVTVSTQIMKTLQEREWIRVLGCREVPGKPAIYGTTREFLDYFNLKSLSDLPTLAEFKDLAAQEKELQIQLAIENGEEKNTAESTEENTENNTAENNVVRLDREDADEADEDEDIDDIDDIDEIIDEAEPAAASDADDADDIDDDKIHVA